MGDYDFNSTSQNISYAYGNTTNYKDGSSSTDFILDVVIYVIIAAGFLSVLVSIYAVFSLVRKDNTAPIYVINLLLADLIQLCSMSVRQSTANIIRKTFFYLYLFGLLAGVGFMVCVSLERYLVIRWPLWYRFRRTIKISLMVCVVVWALPLVLLLPVYFWGDTYVALTTFGHCLLLPFPLFILSLGGTLKALSAASRVPPDEKRRIVATLVLVLIIYTLLFLPSIIYFLAKNTRAGFLDDLSFTMVQFNPIADSFLYVLLRKGAVDKVLASVCCCRMESNDISRSTELVNSQCSAVI
ncbi:mas-related G-protein coupled receptor member B5-like [Channa argus]|uniref:mas-related G-protein coupled receptor member B5-like n=1 Tax=Channa argus TaxID=215402 RepID=UPI00351FA2EE